MTMPGSVIFDHLAVGVRSWDEGFRRFAGQLGGRWSHGGDAGEFAPCQLIFPGGFAVELIAPGSARDGFMHRFLRRSGPGPHHVTFKVPSLDAVLGDLAALGITPLGGRTHLPFWQEAFLHPKQCGIGTLLQVAQSEDAVIRGYATPPPGGFPAVQEPARSVAWVGLTVESLGRARELFGGVLAGDVTEHDDGWLRMTWGPGRDLLVRTAAAAPGGGALWAGDDPGVAHVMFAPAELTVMQLQAGEPVARQLPFDEATAVPVWLAG